MFSSFEPNIVCSMTYQKRQKLMYNWPFLLYTKLVRSPCTIKLVVPTNISITIILLIHYFHLLNIRFKNKFGRFMNIQQQKVHKPWHDLRHRSFNKKNISLNSPNTQTVLYNKQSNNYSFLKSYFMINFGTDSLFRIPTCMMYSSVKS